MKYTLILLLITLKGLSLSFAEENKEAKNLLLNPKNILRAMTEIYSEVVFMKADYSKNESSLLLGTSEKTSGKLEFSKGMIRVKDGDGSLFIKGEKSFWYVSGNQVMTGVVKKSIPNIFSLIFSDKNVWSNFESKHEKPLGKEAHIVVDTKNKVPNIKTFRVRINIDRKTLERVEYMDDANNKIKISLSKVRFFRKVPKGRFFYKIKKKDQVSRL